MEGDLAAVEAYKASGGDIARQLTADEVRLLNRSSAFGAGFTLVHLAIRFQRQDMLAVLLTEVCAAHTNTYTHTPPPTHHTLSSVVFLSKRGACVCV